MKPTNDDDDQFIQEAQAELEALMRGVSDAQPRHAPSTGSRARAIALLEAKWDATRAELDHITNAIDNLQAEADEEPAEQTTVDTIEDEANWMRAARDELHLLIRSVEGPRPRQGGQR